LTLSASPSHQNPHAPLPVALRLWPYVSPLVRLLGWKGRSAFLQPLAHAHGVFDIRAAFAPHEEVHRRYVLFGLPLETQPPQRLQGPPASQGRHRGGLSSITPRRERERRGGLLWFVTSTLPISADKPLPVPRTPPTSVSSETPLAESGSVSAGRGGCCGSFSLEGKGRIPYSRRVRLAQEWARRVFVKGGEGGRGVYYRFLKGGAGWLRKS
jgi:hypothetical protein